MKKCFIFLTTLFFVSVSFAQKTIEGLINAEKSFAAYSVSHSTKEAFMEFLDSSEGIMFAQGKPVKAIDFWSKREKRPGVLNWRPQYAGIASSGDFGFTTGPWTFQATANDTVVARGQYTTVWHVDKTGKWKFLVDLGVENTPANDDVTLNMDNPEDATIYRGSLAEMLKAENDFIKYTSTKTHQGNDRRVWYTRTISTNWGDGVLNRNGQLPADESDKWLDILRDNMPGQIKYTINGSVISTSMDMGYVYGTTEINEKTENYLRVWRKERTGWKVAVEVLRY